jgi:hypothetical protein
LVQDTPGDGEQFLDGAAVDPLGLDLAESHESFGKSMKIRRSGGHV